MREKMGKSFRKNPSFENKKKTFDRKKQSEKKRDLNYDFPKLGEYISGKIRNQYEQQ
jgi:hypothetical protein